MADIVLTQAEADAMLACPKERVDEEIHVFPSAGQRLEIELFSNEYRGENFTLDLARGRIKLTKAKYQNRVRSVIILARLDIDGPPHTNPDGEEIECPHLHVYREGFGTKYAIKVPELSFANTQDVWQTLRDFMKFCNIVVQPNIQMSLF